MYAVSDKFLSAIQDHTRSYFWSGLISTKDGEQYPFSNEEIVKGSAYITNQCCGSTEIEIGTVYAAELGITLYSDINRYSLEGGKIELFFHLQVEDEVYETVPMGIFDISEANRTVKCLEIKAYDYMLRFEKGFTNKVTNGTAFELLFTACEACEVELAPTQEILEAMPNGSIILGIYTENDIETWRDLIFYVAQVLGCFATINREGKLELRQYSNEPFINIPDTQRFTSSFSDFVTRYTAINSTNIRTQESEYYALENDDALTMNLGVNPLLQFGLKETRETLLNNILMMISKINYVPFDSNTIGNPALDLGDVITFSGGHADENQITTITSITYKINGKHSLKCVGKNPRLSQAKSKNDKNIAGLINQIESGKIAVHSYINVSPYTITSSNTQVASLEFASNEDTDAQFHASILLETKADPVKRIGQVSTGDGSHTFSWSEDGKVILEVTYIINDKVLPNYTPVETLTSGKHILNLYYPINGLLANTYNTFKVLIKASGGSVIVGRTQAIATISGQGLASNKMWDGRLEFGDTIDSVSIVGKFEISRLIASVDTRVVDSAPANILQPFSTVVIGGLGVARFNEILSLDPTIATETIVVADKDKMSYSSYYVKTIDRFELQKHYIFNSQESEVDRGRICKVQTNTDQFVRIDTWEVKSSG